MQTRRVALVHDFLLDVRGAERVFLALCDLFPDADVFTAVYDERGHRGALRAPRVRHVVPAARCGPTARTFRALLPLYPYAMEALDLRGYDLVDLVARAPGRTASSPTTDAVHVCYCHNPFRYAWNAREATLRHARPAARAPRSGSSSSAGASGTGSPPSASTATSANSETTRRRIKRYFGRDATVLYPPVETDALRARPASATTTSCSRS